MSSHHFVREGQEPALLIVQAGGFEQVASLLEWAPMVIVTEQSVHQVFAWGIKIDMVIAEAASVELLRQQLITQEPVTIVQRNENNLTETALYSIINAKQEAVNVVAPGTPEFLNHMEPFLKSLTISVIDESAKWSGVTSGYFRKWFPAHTRLFLHKKDEVNTKNIIKNGDCWRVENDGFAEIFSQTTFWVGESARNTHQDE